MTRLEQERTQTAAQLAQLSALQAQNSDLQSKLAATEAARAGLAAKQAEGVTAASDELAGLRTRVQSLETERTALQHQLAEAKTAPAADPAREETETKLATALRSYSLLQTENETLKASTDKLATEKTALEAKLATSQTAADALKTQADGAATAAAQAESGREQLRQAQAQVTALAAENSQLKTRLSVSPPADLAALRAQVAAAERKAADATTSSRIIAEENTRLKSTLAAVSQTVGRVVVSAAPAATPAPASTRPVGAVASGPSAPTRPGTAQATAATTPPPVAPPPVRTHVVSPGDTLGKIARQYYGTANRWPDILAANRDVLRDERSLVVGRVLKIP